MSNASIIMLHDALQAGAVNAVGEILRVNTFVGEGFNFDIRRSARDIKAQVAERPEFFAKFDWTPEEWEKASVYHYSDYDMRIVVCWYRDGDDCLQFYVESDCSLFLVRNDDCKKDHNWEHVNPMK